MIKSTFQPQKGYDRGIEAMNECLADISNIFERCTYSSKKYDWIKEHVDLDKIDTDRISNGELKSIPIEYKGYQFEIDTEYGRLSSDISPCGVSMSGDYWAIKYLGDDVMEQSGMDEYVEKAREIAVKAMLDYLTPDVSDISPRDAMEDKDKDVMYEHFCERGGLDISDKNERLEKFKKDINNFPGEYAELANLNDLIDRPENINNKVNTGISH